jgi:glycosyltransferase involved in cell wall biosynthesis
VHLLVYAHGDGSRDGDGITLHRLADWPKERSLRSGPTVGKALLDVRLAVSVRRLCQEVRPDIIHAHNYEALAACLAARPAEPLLYHAHTVFGPELPTYLPEIPLATGARLVGELADRLLPPRADFTVAVSPRLLSELVERGHPRWQIRSIPPGIALPKDREAGGRAAKALHHGLEGKELVCYAGNLDAYQGIELLLEAMKILATERPRVALLVVTASDPEPMRQRAADHGITRQLVFAPHGRFSEVLELVGTADVCVVPRTIPGGFPVKLLTYLAASRPVVSTISGSAGLDLGRAVVTTPDADPTTLAGEIIALLESPERRAEMGHEGRKLVEACFSWDRATDALEEVLWSLVASRRRARYIPLPW